MEDFATLFADYLLTESTLGNFVGPDNVQIIVHHTHVVADRLEHGIELALAFSEGLLGRLSLGDIHGGAQKTLFTIKRDLLG